MRFDASLPRRSFLRRTGTLALVSATSAGCSGGDETGGGNTPQQYDGWMSDARNYSGTVDRTDEGTVTVDVGVGDPAYGFEPAAVRVSVGTDVQWRWTGKGGDHNVRAVEGAEFESELYTQPGVQFTYSVSEAGTINYQCDPHSSVGMKGVIRVE